MAQGRDDINQRVVLTGDEEVIAQLRAIERQGSKTFDTIGDASKDASKDTSKSFDAIGNASKDAANTAQSAWGRLSASAKSAFSSVGEAVAPIGGALQELATHTQTFGTALSNVANNIFPHFKEILALGSAASAVGLFEMTKAAVESEHQLQLNAAQIGINVEAFKAYGRAAREAGVDQETLLMGLTRFNIALQKNAEETKKTLLDLAKTAVSDRVKQGGGRFARDSEEDWAAAQKAAQLAMAEMGDSAEATFGSLSRLANDFYRLIRQGGDAGRKAREDLAKLGIALSPQDSIEAIERQMPGFQNAFKQLGLTIDDLVGPDGKALQLQDVFVKFAESFGKLTPVEQARIAMEQFGRSGLRLLPFLQNAPELLAKFPNSFKKMFDETAAGTPKIDKLHAEFLALDAAIGRIKKTIGLAFAGVFEEPINALVASLQASQVAIKQWATDIANQAKPIIVDFFRVLSNPNAQAQNQWVADMVNGVRNFVTEITNALPTIKALGDTVMAVFNGIATVINSVFGTNLSGTAVAVVVAIGTVSGAFTALAAAVAVASAAVGVLDAAISVMLTGPIAAFIIAFGPEAVVIAAVVALGAALITLTGQWRNLLDMVRSVIFFITDIAVGAFNGLVAAVQSLFGPIQRAIELLGRMLSLSGQAGAAKPGGIPMAGGGMVIGPGSGTSDSIAARLSNGEFVMRRAAVEYWGPRFMANLNALGNMGSLMPRRSGRFAEGGLVAAGGGTGRAVHLHLGGHEFALSGSGGVVDSLVTEANRQRMRSGGLKPSWYGGRVSG